MFGKRTAFLLSLLLVLAFLLAQCGPTPEPVIEKVIETVVVEQTKIVEKEGEVQTVVETQGVEQLGEQVEVALFLGC